MTIKDLARESGYSLGTVSRVLNGHPNVSDAARKAVMAVVEARGFELNTNAKNLKQSRGNCLLVMVKGRGNELFAAMVERYQAIFARTSYTLLVEYIDELDNEVHRAATLCRERKPRGILFLGGSLGHFREGFGRIQVPSVLVTGSARELGFPNLSSVSTDDRQGAACAVSHLLTQGHREILVLGGDRQKSDTSRLRYCGCLDAFDDRDLHFDESRYCTCRYSYASGYETMAKALDAGTGCTAVYAMADVIAIGAMRAIRERGLRVPEDISVMGYDGLTVGDYLQPRLTTMAQPAEAMACRSAQLLLAHMEEQLPAEHEMIPAELVRRQSVQQLG